MRKKLKRTLFKRSVWTMLTIFFALLMTLILVAGSVADNYQAAINKYLDTNPYEKIEGNNTNEDTEYYKSDYYNADGTYNDQKMRKNSQDVALQTAVEGSVILWNNDNALPLAENKGVSLFGISSANYAYLGTGSGGMSVSVPNELRTEFTRNNLKLNISLLLKYTDLISDHKRQPTWAVNEVAWNDISATVNSTINTFGDCAVMILSRVAGESSDIKPSTADNFIDDRNYLDITQTEAEILTNLKNLKSQGKIKKIAVLINSANAMQFKNLTSDAYGIDACVWVGMGGAMSYAQISDVLSNRGGNVVSGHLPDTYVYSNRSAPSYANFGDYTWSEYSQNLPDLDNQGKHSYTTFNIKYLVYQEDIYVGYHYYETRYEDCVTGKGNANGTKGVVAGNGNWSYSDEVIFPFGYGGSYTEFEYSEPQFKKMSDGNYEVSVTITNSGDKYSGKETLQVYLQKPYTDYDKANKIEKSAIQLVGFDKTKILAPNESQTLKTIVNAEEFKTYDAYNKKTYILESGNYYLSIGTNAHDALNNVLSYKGYNVSNGMDYNGKSNFAYEIKIDNDNFTKYSKSSENKDYAITNQFDDADVNIYEGTNDQKITYLSRSDWEGTYPTQKVSLKCVNDKMVSDMQYGQPIVANSNDKMPVYNTVTAPEGELTIAMLKGLEFDDPKWQDLLNQMSIQEQEFLMSYGLNHIAGVASVGAPGAKAVDGPAGVKVNNSALKTQFAFPSQVNLAATFNTSLVKELGRAFGLEALHVGYTVLYAPGGCIHRSAYSGRNWEYFSEDAFISGKMLAAEVQGMQERGSIVLTKHFVLNDEETNRYGVATFANEQSIRENYLKAFEIAVVEGKMNGVMSSFNRIGTTWSGAHKGLLTNVLRNEWGFNGIVETDSCTSTMTEFVHHMTSTWAKAEGLIAGNDVWMCGTGSESFVKEHEDNATIMLALREACHRVLYAQLNSNAMNGISTSTRIVKVKTWWQKAISGTGIGLITATSVLFLMCVASFVVNSKYCNTLYAKIKADRIDKKIERQKQANNVVLNQNGKNSSGEEFDEGENKPKLKDKKKLIISIVAISLAVVIIVSSISIPIAINLNKPAPSPGPDIINPGDDDKNEDELPDDTEKKCPVCGGCLNPNAEGDTCENICGDGKAVNIFEAEEAKLSSGTKGALKIEKTGDVKYVGQLNENNGASVIYTVTSNQATTASLVITVSYRSVETTFTNNLLVLVNNEEFTSTSIVPASSTGKDEWWTFVDVNLGCINLVEGENTFAFYITSTSNLNGYNFDRIKLLTDAELSYVAPDYDCDMICDICGKCMDSTCSIPTHQDKCGSGAGTVTKFEAESAVLGAGVKGAPIVEKGTFVGNLSENKDATITFTINSSEATIANLTAAVSRRSSELKFIEGLKVIVNGVEIYRNSVVPMGPNGNDWFTFVDVYLGCINLKQGQNTIVFKVASTSNANCFNFDYIKIKSQTSIS